MSRTLGVALSLALSLAGCGVDLLVGGEETGTSGAGSTTDEPGNTTSLPPMTDDGASTSTGAIDPDTTTGETSTGPDEGTAGTGSTSTGPGSESTTGEIACEGLGFEDCVDVTYCLWYGEPRMGECGLSPCEQPKNECWELVFELCTAELPCAWVGDPELGECGPIECVPCEVLDQLQCGETPTCVWNELEEACFDA